jgi:hypothetical protein
MESDCVTFGGLALSEFPGALSSADPTPDGGSASSVAGALAAGLVISTMADPPLGRPRYQPFEATTGRARADGVDFAPAATKALAHATDLGLGALPVCMAKTQYSLSNDSTLKGRPAGFRLPVRDIGIRAGAGFITLLAVDMRTMPGLPSHPAGEKIDLDAQGRVEGLI